MLPYRTLCKKTILFRFLLIFCVCLLGYHKFKDGDLMRHVQRSDFWKNKETYLPSNNYEGWKKSIEKDQRNRLDRIRTVCEKTNIPGQVNQLFTYSPSNVSYCSNHKVASTYWIRVFRFLHRDVTHVVQKPSDISKQDVHFEKFRKLKKLDFQSQKDHSEVMNSYRFMMTRDPYERLWSVYIDKFVLVDPMFWNDYSHPIRQMFLLETSGMVLVKKCVQISFCEFLLYVARVGTHASQALDDHMRPVHYGCNPCLFKPNFIGVIENLTQEKNPILERLGLLGLDDVTDFEAHVINEIQTISSFESYVHTRLGRVEQCVSNVHLEERLLKAFVLNGYLPQATMDMLKPSLPFGIENFADQIVSVFRKLRRSPAEVKKQRFRLMAEAYRQVPMATLKVIKHIFRYDFLLFGYPSDPNYIFELEKSNDSNRNCEAERFG